MISPKDAVHAMKEFSKVQAEFDRKRSSLQKQADSMRKLPDRKEMPPWVDDVQSLFASSDYSFWQLIRTLRRHKVL